MEDYKEEIKEFFEQKGLEDGQWVTFIDDHQHPEELIDFMNLFAKHIIDRGKQVEVNNSTVASPRNEVIRIKYPSKDIGRTGCTYNDTEYSSLDVVYGYNMAIDHMKEMNKDFKSSPACTMKVVDVPLIPLAKMSGNHFKQIFYGEGFSAQFVKEKIEMFVSLYGFASCIANFGKFDSYRKAVELGYDVEFTRS